MLIAVGFLAFKLFWGIYYFEYLVGVKTMQAVTSQAISNQDVKVNSAKISQQLDGMLAAVLHHTEWQYGEIWLPISHHQIDPAKIVNPLFDHQIDPQRVLLELSQIWAIDPNQSFLQLHAWENFWSCSRGFLLSANEGLPGRAWFSNNWEWISDVSTHSEYHFLRNQIARAFQVKAGLAIPLTLDSAHNRSVHHRATGTYGAEKLYPDGVALFFMAEGRGQDNWLINQTLTVLAENNLISPQLVEFIP